MIKVFSAPIQGYTDCTWRNAHSTVFAGSVERYYAPFLRLEKGAFRNKDLRDIAPEENTSYCLVPQAIACPHEQFAIIIDKIASMGYGEIDINMGCPFPPMTKRHCGAGILPYPNEVAAMLAVTKNYPGIKFSIKMRLGLESPDDWQALMPIIGEIKPVHVTMHPRTARQQYGGEIDMAQFQRFYAQATFPVVYNGDLRTAADIDRITSEFPDLRAIMIGRGLLANPALTTTQDGNTVKRVIELHNILFDTYKSRLCGDAHLLAKMKSLWEYFLSGAGSPKCRKKILKSTTIGKYVIATDDFWLSLNDAPFTGNDSAL